MPDDTATPLADGIESPLDGPAAASSGAEDAASLPSAASPDLIDHLGPSLAELRSQLDAVTAAAVLLREAVADRLEQARTREALLDRLEASRPGFQFQLLRPFVTRLAGLSDLVAEWVRVTPTDPVVFADRLRLLDLQLAELLAMHGVEAVRPAEGDSFDSRFHFVVETRPTDEPARRDRVAEAVQHGFVYYGTHDRTAAIVPTLVRPAKVVTWKYDPGPATASDPTPATTPPD